VTTDDEITDLRTTINVEDSRQRFEADLHLSLRGCGSGHITVRVSTPGQPDQSVTMEIPTSGCLNDSFGLDMSSIYQGLEPGAHVFSVFASASRTVFLEGGSLEIGAPTPGGIPCSSLDLARSRLREPDPRLLLSGSCLVNHPG
jgi:hypothetical protein